MTLYRTYRPQQFADLVGQDHIRTTLQAALASGRLGHAYLFAGPRGTGKTTVARLLAKAVNCQKTEDSGLKPEVRIQNFEEKNQNQTPDSRLRLVRSRVTSAIPAEKLPKDGRSM